MTTSYEMSPSVIMGLFTFKKSLAPLNIQYLNIPVASGNNVYFLFLKELKSMGANEPQTHIYLHRMPILRFCHNLEQSP